MKAIAFTEFGGPEVLKFIDLPEPVPKAGEVLVRTDAIGLNFADIYRRRGGYTLVPPSPYILGYEGAGLVRSIGPGVSDFEIGDRVAFVDVPRANAEIVAAPAAKLIPLPKSISFPVAAAVLLQGMTAHYLLHESYTVRPGTSVLVHAAAGGVGQNLCQMASILGAKVIGVVSTREKVDIARRSGAEFVIVSSEEDFVAASRQFTQGEGVDVVYDSVGSTLLDSVRAAKVRGHVVFFGWAGGDPPAIDPKLLMNESKTLTGGDLWNYVTTTEELHRRAEDLFLWIDQGQLKPNIAAQFPLAETAKAHVLLESRKALGKILLMPRV